MHKDVIYIDTEDDITAIIGKIKSSKEKVVALVPPKRIGILQSAVNLRLLARMADNSSKRLVLVTSNKALINLSSVAKIPVAKNLQSKPEMAEIDVLEVDDGEDVIEGEKLPIGELMKTADLDENGKVVDVIDAIDVEEDGLKVESKSFGKSEVKVPNFSSFRKKLFIGILLLIGLSGFLVWAIIYAPTATVIVTAKTSPVDASTKTPIKLDSVAVTDVSKGVIQSITKQIIKDVSVTFTATEEENVGEKATGTITISNCDSSTAFTLPSGTIFTSVSGLTFSSANQTTVPGFIGSASACQKSGTGAGVSDVEVAATKPGGRYNLGSVNYTISGISGFIYAHGGQMAGGTDKMSIVVSAADVAKANQALIDLSSDSMKPILIAQFTNGEFVINDSFSVVHDTAVPTPLVGVAAPDGKATLTSKTTFSLAAIAKSELEIFLTDAVNKQITSSSQRLYADGIENATLSDYRVADTGATINIIATGQIGPNIDKDPIKQQVKGLQFGDAQALISGIPGVNNVEINFSYFWVTKVPTNIDKIDVQFIIQND